MKTTKLFLSIALVALAATSFGSTTEGVCEEALELENWMSAPFEAGLLEGNLVMEDWMSVPFEEGVAEEGLSLESWMTTPFETPEDTEVEQWMCAAWI